jgi:RloB-like protein
MAKKLFDTPKLGRKGATRDIRPIIHVFCEGKVTEPEYLLSFYRQIKVKLTVLPRPRGGAGEPLTIVKTCIAHREELRQAVHDRWREVDQVWAVFDKDEHIYFDDAVALARKNEVRLAISNPCIEIWGLLHGEDPCDKPMGRREAQKAVKAIFPDYDHDKNPVFDWDRCSETWKWAGDNATRGLRARDGEDSPFPNGNPSSNFHCLLLAILGRQMVADHKDQPRIREL